MKKLKFYTVLLVLLVTLGSPMHAEAKVGSGYAIPTFRELSQTILMLGGLDINDDKVAEEYIKIAYCQLYKDNYNNDFNWNKIKTDIISRVVDKKEYYRTLYQTVEVFRLDRYDFKKGYFPVTKQTAMSGIGSLVLHDYRDFKPYCDGGLAGALFTPNISLLLDRRLTINKLDVDKSDLNKVLAIMNEVSDEERIVYARIRFRVTEALGLTYLSKKVTKSELRGYIDSIDFFYDYNLTKPAESIIIFK